MKNARYSPLICEMRKEFLKRTDESFTWESLSVVWDYKVCCSWSIPLFLCPFYIPKSWGEILRTWSNLRSIVRILEISRKLTSENDAHTQTNDPRFFRSTPFWTNPWSKKFSIFWEAKVCIVPATVYLRKELAHPEYQTAFMFKFVSFVSLKPH